MSRRALLPIVRTRLLQLGAVAHLLGLILLASFAGGTEAAAPGAIIALAYDGGSGTLLKAGTRGLYRSRDEGKSWDAIPIGFPDASARIAGIGLPAGGGRMYVAGPGLGVLRQDGGDGWISVSDGLPSRDVMAFATHATQPDTLYAYLAENGIYRSQDAGKSWRLMDRGPEGIRQLVHSSLTGSMETGWLYAATAQGASLSMDCFCLWRALDDFGGPVVSLAYDQRQPERVYAASAAGVFRSDSGGKDWQRATAPNGAVAALAVAPSGIVYAATRDGGLFKSSDGAASWKRADA